MNDQTARESLGAGIVLAGLTLAQVSTLVTIVAGIAATFASLAAGLYYWKKWREK